jgi:hypothetical protein
MSDTKESKELKFIDMKEAIRLYTQLEKCTHSEKLDLTEEKRNYATQIARDILAFLMKMEDGTSGLSADIYVQAVSDLRPSLHFKSRVTRKWVVLCPCFDETGSHNIYSSESVLLTTASTINDAFREIQKAVGESLVAAAA